MYKFVGNVVIRRSVFFFFRVDSIFPKEIKNKREKKEIGKKEKSETRDVGTLARRKRGKGNKIHVRKPLIFSRFNIHRAHVDVRAHTRT